MAIAVDHPAYEEMISKVYSTRVEANAPYCQMSHGLASRVACDRVQSLLEKALAYAIEEDIPVPDAPYIDNVEQTIDMIIGFFWEKLDENRLPFPQIGLTISDSGVIEFYMCPVGMRITYFFEKGKEMDVYMTNSKGTVNCKPRSSLRL